MEQHLFVHDMDKWTKNHRSHEIESAQTHTYDHAIVLPLQRNPELQSADGIYRGGVCSADFTFIAGRQRRTDGQHVNWNCDTAYEVPAENIVHRDEDVIFGGCLINHFGHALLDGTARLWYLTEAPADLRIVFLRYPRETRAPFDALKFVELMGIDMSRVEVIDQPTQFRSVIVPDEAIYPSQAYRPEYIRTFDRIREHIEAKNDSKVYMSRTHFNFRSSLNEEYYEQFFARRGFTVIHPEELSIEEQIAYVAGADEIVTTMGSMAHLFLFAKPTATTTILNRSTQCLTAQIVINQARGITSYFVDAYCNPLPVPHVFGPFLFGPNRFFQAYLDERGIAYEPRELHMDDAELIDYTRIFMEEWAKLYCTSNKREHLEAFKTIDVAFYAADYAAGVAGLLHMDAKDPDAILPAYPLCRQLKSRQDKLAAENKKLKGDLKRSQTDLKRSQADLKRSQAEIEHLRSSKSWKVTAPLRAVTRLFSGKKQ